MLWMAIVIYEEYQDKKVKAKRHKRKKMTAWRHKKTDTPIASHIKQDGDKRLFKTPSQALKLQTTRYL